MPCNLVGIVSTQFTLVRFCSSPLVFSISPSRLRNSSYFCAHSRHFQLIQSDFIRILLHVHRNSPVLLNTRFSQLITLLIRMNFSFGIVSEFGIRNPELKRELENAGLIRYRITISYGPYVLYAILFECFFHLCQTRGGW